MPGTAAAPSLDTIVDAASKVAQDLTDYNAWPKATGMLAWWGFTRTDNGERKFTYIGVGVWLGTDGRLWHLFSRNWWMHAVPLLTNEEAEMDARAHRRGLRHVPAGLHSSDMMSTAFLESFLWSPDLRQKFMLALEAKAKKLKAKR